jgi:hypothetical protein
MLKRMLKIGRWSGMDSSGSGYDPVANFVNMIINMGLCGSKESVDHLQNYETYRGGKKKTLQRDF